jgi:hypothetical protein
LHKERFDEFIGLLNPKWLELDRSAFARGLRERLLDRLRAICSDVKCHVRLEDRRIVSPRKIVDNSLKKTVRRLRRD